MPQKKKRNTARETSTFIGALIYVLLMLLLTLVLREQGEYALVWGAARSLESGDVLQEADLVQLRMPWDDNQGMFRAREDLTGRVVSATLSAREVITTAHVPEAIDVWVPKTFIAAGSCITETMLISMTANPAAITGTDVLRVGVDPPTSCAKVNGWIAAEDLRPGEPIPRHAKDEAVEIWVPKQFIAAGREITSTQLFTFTLVAASSVTDVLRTRDDIYPEPEGSDQSRMAIHDLLADKPIPRAAITDAIGIWVPKQFIPAGTAITSTESFTSTLVAASSISDALRTADDIYPFEEGSDQRRLAIRDLPADKPIARAAITDAVEIWVPKQFIPAGRAIASTKLFTSTLVAASSISSALRTSDDIYPFVEGSEQVRLVIQDLAAREPIPTAAITDAVEVWVPLRFIEKGTEIISTDSGTEGFEKKWVGIGTVLTTTLRGGTPIVKKGHKATAGQLLMRDVPLTEDMITQEKTEETKEKEKESADPAYVAAKDLDAYQRVTPDDVKCNKEVETECRDKDDVFNPKDFLLLHPVAEGASILQSDVIWCKTDPEYVMLLTVKAVGALGGDLHPCDTVDVLAARRVMTDTTGAPHLLDTQDLKLEESFPVTDAVVLDFQCASGICEVTLAVKSDDDAKAIASAATRVDFFLVLRIEAREEVTES